MYAFVASFDSKTESASAPRPAAVPNSTWSPSSCTQSGNGIFVPYEGFEKIIAAFNKTTYYMAGLLLDPGRMTKKGTTLSILRVSTLIFVQEMSNSVDVIQTLRDAEKPYIFILRKLLIGRVFGLCKKDVSEIFRVFNSLTLHMLLLSTEMDGVK